MRRSRLIALLVALLALAGLPGIYAVQAGTPPATIDPLLEQALDRAAPADEIVAIANLDAPASPSDVAALEATGALVHPYRHLPMAGVVGTADVIRSVGAQPVVRSLYWNEPQEYHLKESQEAIGASEVWDLGLHGEGVGIAILDTGVDATHPDLADHVVQNVKILGPQYLRLPHDTFEAIYVEGVASSDTTSGHGTHVAGIVAADAHTSPDQVGVAPDASIIGYGAGDAISIFTVLAAFDDILVHHREWGIRVVNNSWGSSGRLFDPAHPINVASKALHDAGLVVVFSAGNDGLEGTINPYSVAPWVVSAGSATNARDRSAFSSGGYEHDNSLPAAVPGDRHVRFDGDRLGIYHPDVSSPGSDIVSSGTPTGVGVLSPALPGGTATLSGTSMAAPHISGIAALLFEARPSLTPDQVRQVLQVTAAPMRGEAAFFQSGYGFTDARAAVDLVRRPDFSPGLLDGLQAAADERVLRARPFSVRASDLWSFTPLLPVTASGLDTRVFTTEVADGTDAVRAVVTYPSLALVGVNPFDWQISLADAAGTVVATSTPSPAAGVSSLFVELDRATVRYGTWKVTVTGVLGVSDTDALVGNVVTLAVAQVARRTPDAVAAGPRFVPAGATTLFFQRAVPPTLALPVPLPSPEGCALTQGAVDATMGGSAVPDACTSGVVGWAMSYGLDIPATFTSPALAQPVVVGGPATLTLWLVDPAAPVWTEGFASRVGYALDAVAPDGTATSIAEGAMERTIDGAEEVRAEPTRADYAFTVSPTPVPAGSTLRLRLRFSGAYASGLRMLFGGPYADSGLTVTLGRMAG